MICFSVRQQVLLLRVCVLSHSPRHDSFDGLRQLLVDELNECSLGHKLVAEAERWIVMSEAGGGVSWCVVSVGIDVEGGRGSGGGGGDDDGGGGGGGGELLPAAAAAVAS